MDNLGDSQNGQPGATNAGQDQGATGISNLGNSALGYVMVDTGQGTAQTTLHQGGIQPAAFLAAGAAAAAGTHTMAPTAPPWPRPHPGLGLTPELLNAVMGVPDGAGAAAQPAALGGGGVLPNVPANAAAAGPMPPAYPNFGQRFPQTIDNQAVRADHTMDVDTAALNLLGQAANMSPPAGLTGRGGYATAAAGAGGTTGGFYTGQTGMDSNVGGGVGQAIAGAGEGPRPPGTGPGAAAAAAAGLPPPPRTFPFAPPRGTPIPPTGGAPFGMTTHVPPPQATTAGAPTPRQGGGPRGFAATTAAANAGARGVHFGATDQFGLPIPPAPRMQAQARPPPPPPPQAQAAAQAAATADNAAARRAAAQQRLGPDGRAGGAPLPPPRPAGPPPPYPGGPPAAPVRPAPQTFIPTFGRPPRGSPGRPQGAGSPAQHYQAGRGGGGMAVPGHYGPGRGGAPRGYVGGDSTGAGPQARPIGHGGGGGGPPPAWPARPPAQPRRYSLAV